MKSQSLTITGRSFYKFRALMDASLEKAVEKMLAAGVSEGTVSGQITIKLDRSVNDETGEVTIRPRFVFNTTLSVPVKTILLLSNSVLSEAAVEPLAVFSVPS